MPEARVDEVDAPPSLLGLYARSAAGSLLPGRPAGLPERRLVLRGVEIDLDRLARYARVCGCRIGAELPPTYPHLLGFALELRLMSDRSFPFPVLGIVHVANRIEQLRPVPVDSRPDVLVHAANLRPHRSGSRFDVVTEVELGGETAWRERSTYLRPGAPVAGATGATGAPEDGGRGLAEPAGPVVAEWSIAGDVGRRYAEVSGDRNPIHIHPLLAKPFGFPGAIAPGMWTKARCLAALEGRLGDAFEAEVEFRKPLRIPARVRLRLGRRGEGWRFALEPAAGGDGRPHLTGSAGG